MGKKLKVSQPLIINTELTPLEDSFWLSPNGATEQWYYENTGEYSVDRSITPLTITPVVRAVDSITHIEYDNIQFVSTPTWTVYQMIDSVWTPQVITTTSSSELYYKSGNNLIVRANNNDAANGILIVCKLQYIDPRNSGMAYLVQANIELTANRDAATLLPTMKILNPPVRYFDPLVDDYSLVSFAAYADWSAVESESVSSDYEFVWYATNEMGGEVLIETMPFYKYGQGTDSLVIDAMYGESINIVLAMKRHSTDTDLLPMRKYASLVWEVPPMQGLVTCQNGNTVKGDEADYEFRTIINTNIGELDEDKIKANLRFNWKMRSATPRTDGYAGSINDTETDMGWGYNLVVPARQLICTWMGRNSSRLVSNDIYLLGAYQQATYNGDTLTYNGNNVVARVLPDD